MVEISADISNELEMECRELLLQSKNSLRAYRKRQKRLVTIINKEYNLLDTALMEFPQFDGSHEQLVYGEYKRGFELLLVQFQNLLRCFVSPRSNTNNLAIPTNQDKETQENYRDDLLDQLKEDDRSVDQQERAEFLEVLKVLDSIHRLQEFDFPEAGLDGELYRGALVHLKRIIVGTGNKIEKILRIRGVEEIELLPGEFPPIETTRIISREDGNTSEEIVISRIIEKGYIWKSKILRKAVVSLTMSD